MALPRGVLFAIFAMCCLSIFGQGNIRVEPPNWWSGMVHNEVEIMFYGADIGTYDLTLEDYIGIQLKAVARPSNPNYIFATIIIENGTLPGNLKFVLSKKGTSPKTVPYPILKRKPEQDQIQGFDSSDAIYLITPDRFANGNPMNDSVGEMKEKAERTNVNGRHGGDIAGISAHLDYIKDLGFTALWSNPLLENNMKEYSYHGYATTDFYRVDPRFGDNKSFKALCTKAKQKGLKVIMDMIVNHCGSDHWWMNDLPYEDWINQWPKYTGTNHRKTVILDPHASALDRKQFFDGWFVPTMPDLNQRNPSLAKYLVQNTLWWIEYSGISGIRMDTYPYPDMYFMSDWSRAVMTEYPNFNIVGEEWVIRPTMVSYWQAGKENPNDYTSSLKSLMDFPLQNALVTSLNNEKTWQSSWIDVYEALGQDYLYPDPNNLVVFPDNHDMSRIYTQVNEDLNKFKMALVYTATVRGIPQFYYGTEILMGNPGTTEHGVIRSDFPGGWEGDTVNAFNGEGLSDIQKETQQFVRTLLSWRKNAIVVHQGDLLHFAPKGEEEVYVFFRYNDTEKVLVAFNKNPKTVHLDLSTYSEIIPPNIKGTAILSGTRIEAQDVLSIQPNSCLIIELE